MCRLERGETFIDRARKVAGAQILVADFGGEENVLARNTRGAHRLADRALGAVFARGVDVAVTGLQRREDGFGGQPAGERRGAEAERRDGAGFPGKREVCGGTHGSGGCGWAHNMTYRVLAGLYSSTANPAAALPCPSILV